MAEAAISCSSGCAVQIRSIRDRWLPVKSRTERFLRPGQDTPSQMFAARLSFFTLPRTRNAVLDIHSTVMHNTAMNTWNRVRLRCVTHEIVEIAKDPAAPFIDRAGYLGFIDRAEKKFREALADEQGSD